MTDITDCPICGPVYGGIAQIFPQNGHYQEYHCDICGRYRLTNRLLATNADYSIDNLSNLRRAAISHLLSVRDNKDHVAKIGTNWESDEKINSALPNPMQQAINIIRYIGDHVQENGLALSGFPKEFPAIIGSPSPNSAIKLVHELKERNLIKGIGEVAANSSTFHNADLTLEGWERYEQEKRGKLSGDIGFIAMKFGDTTLDDFVKGVIKPCIKNKLGYDLYDMRDVTQAGIIDNLMRAQIRDSAFVIVDLTHDNPGAYWEAGYAEGLGKPVIYICEENKFKDTKTHFDKNHCTTVIWSNEKHREFSDELIATIRRSLNLFD